LGGVPRVVGAAASVIVPCTIESRIRQAIMEEVDKGCNEFCETVGTVTRIASILIHRWLQVKEIPHRDRHLLPSQTVSACAVCIPNCPVPAGICPHPQPSPQ